ncbi:MAG: ADP-ribosylglycohydrolase family protein [Deltaproteobacteria bacterium]|nr:ADP-ribosylglycohydrolase family protein [Deltaproteobacteria bacterium]
MRNKVEHAGETRGIVVRDKAEAMVLASFAADSLALGVHWIYHAQQISNQHGRVEKFIKPREGSYHPTKEKGEFTHYGDQQLVLLESVAAKGGFDLNDFSERWQRFFRDYDGYFDGATKKTLANFSQGKGPQDSGSPSNDLAGAARIAPLAFCYRDNLDELVRAARAQTRMTHADPLSVHSAEFLARVTWKTLNGASPSEAITEVAEKNYSDTVFTEWIQQGFQSKDMETVSAISRFGLTCHTPDAFPGVIHLVAKYEKDLKEALVQAVMAGGDNAARGMAVGMIVGAHLGKEHFPEQWLTELRKGGEIRNLLIQIG